MDEDTSALLSDLTTQDPIDNAFVVLAAVAASLPFVGGAAGVVVDVVRRRQDTRMAEFVVELATAYRDLRERLDQDFVGTADFANRLTAVIEEAAGSRNRSKRDAYMAAALNAGTRTRPDDDHFELMISTLGRLDAVHLRLLARLVRIGTIENVNGMWQAMVNAEPDLDDAVRLRLWEDLAALGLVESRAIVTDDPLRSAPDADPNLSPVTVFGLRFVTFVSKP